MEDAITTEGLNFSDMVLDIVAETLVELAREEDGSAEPSEVLDGD